MKSNRGGFRATFCLMRYQRAHARSRLVALTFQLLSRIAFILFIEEELAEPEAEFFYAEVALDFSPVANRNLACFLGDDECDGVGLFSEAEACAMAKAEVAIQILTLRERKNAGCGDDAVAADDHAAVVKNGFGLKDGEGKFF